MIAVKIDSEDSRLVEKAYYEYQASLNILNFILKQENINQEYVDEYLKKSENYFITLEKYKNFVSNKYMPEGNTVYNYSFDFINETINFYEQGE